MYKKRVRLFVVNKFEEYKSLINDFKWSIFSVGFLQGGNFINSIIIARIIGKLNFGIYGAVISTASMIIGVAGAGLSIAATKFVAERKEVGLGRVGRIIGLCQAITITTAIFYASIMAIFSKQISSYFLNDSSKYKILLLAVPYMFFMVLNLYQTGAFQGFRSFKKISIFNGLNFFLSFTLIIILGLAFSLQGVIIAMSISSFINWVLFRKYLRKHFTLENIQITWVDIKKEYPLVQSFFIPALLSGIIGSIGPWLVNMFLVGTENGYSEMAIFIAANSYKSFIIIIPTLLSKVYTPLICEYRNKNKYLYRKYIYQNLAISLIVCILISVAVIVFFPYLMNLFGRDFNANLNLILFLCFSAFLDVIVAGLYLILYSQGLMKYQFYISLLWTIVLVCCSLLMIDNYGSEGLAFSYCIASFSSICVYVYLFFSRKLKLSSKL